MLLTSGSERVGGKGLVSCAASRSEQNAGSAMRTIQYESLEHSGICKLYVNEHR